MSLISLICHSGAIMNYELTIVNYGTDNKHIKSGGDGGG